MKTPLFSADKVAKMKAEADARVAAVRAERAKGRTWTERTLISGQDIISRDEGSSPARFNCVSIEAWVALAESANVNHIPLRKIGEIDIDIMEGSFNQNPSDIEVMDAFERDILSALGPDEMIRLDPLALAETKMTCSEGLPMSNGSFYSDHFKCDILNLCTDRTYDVLMDHGSRLIPVFARPIIELETCCERRLTDEELLTDYHPDTPDRSWPAEFRVFIEDFKVVGIAHYYRQVDMDQEQFTPAAREAIYAARQMVGEMKRLNLGIGNYRMCPDEDPGQGDVIENWGEQSFTLDFVVPAGDTNSVIFLEGGPAGLGFADPCAMLIEGSDPKDPNFLHGASFSVKGPKISLDELMNDCEIGCPDPI